MAANGTRTIIWDNGEDEFCLSRVEHILALEDKCKAGIAVIMQRLGSGTWGLQDVRETIRLGLIGGGKTAEQAMTATKLHVDAKPLASSVLVAYAVLEAVMIGVPDDPVGKEPPAEAMETTQPTGSTMTTDASDAPRSSPSAQPSAGRRGSPSSTRSGK